MLREIGSVRQDCDRGLRRWFQDDDFDLYVWQRPDGQLIAFQLCYERGRAEGMIGWSAANGYIRGRVDAARDSPKRAMTPIVRPNALVPYFKIYRRFLLASAGCEPALRAALEQRLRAYRDVLYGTPRRPRRRRGVKAGPTATSHCG